MKGILIWLGEEEESVTPAATQRERAFHIVFVFFYLMIVVARRELLFFTSKCIVKTLNFMRSRQIRRKSLLSQQCIACFLASPKLEFISSRRGDGWALRVDHQDAEQVYYNYKWRRDTRNLFCGMLLMSVEKNLATKQMLILINFPLEVGRDTSTLFVISPKVKS